MSQAQLFSPKTHDFSKPVVRDRPRRAVRFLPVIIRSSTVWASLAAMLLLTCRLSAQQVSPPREQGRALIAALQRIGWMGIPLSAEASGRLVSQPNSSAKVSTVHVVAAAGNKLRMEYGGEKGTATWVILGDGGQSVSADGRKSPLPQHIAGTAHQWMFPWLIGDRWVANARTVEAISDSNPESGRIGFRVQSGTARAQLTPVPVRSQVQSISIWFLPDGTPDRVTYTLPSQDNPYSNVEVTRVYSECKRVNGIVVPFVEDEFIDKVLVSHLQFDQINLGPVDDSKFTLR
ncbi:MAG TPA: hypothetical protein VGN16_05045 [Acidobacteriaceae bacterium]|jgi:hypothetical protein